ncbi:ROK family transcriptional regulator [Gordonia soli]
MALVSVPTQGPATAGLHSAARLIDLVRTRPEITRAEAAQELGMGSGAATGLMKRMRRDELLDETPAPARGRGRPTTVLRPHPDGPLVIAVELSPTGWRVATAALDGDPTVHVDTPRLGSDPQEVLAAMAGAIAAVHGSSPDRVRAISVSVAGTVSDQRLVQFTRRGWMDVDLSALTADLPPGIDLPLLVDNDATLAGLAEARIGTATGVSPVLHLIITVGIGGALIVDGVPARGARGSAGEYGHMPFGDLTRRCPCGAYGCWDLTVDGRTLAARLGDPDPDDPRSYAYRVLAQSDRNPATQSALADVAASLGRGIAGLVNMHDPEVVTLGGLAAPLRAAEPERFLAAYESGLMSFRKAAPPPIMDGTLGEDGPLRGAALNGIDLVTTIDGLAGWLDR